VLRNEHRDRAVRIECPTTGGEVAQGIPVSLLTAQQHGQQRRDKATATLDAYIVPQNLSLLFALYAYFLPKNCRSSVFAAMRSESA
jgi:hypothetical protein